MNYIDVLRNISSHVIPYAASHVSSDEFVPTLREFYSTVPSYNAVKVKPVLVVGSNVYRAVFAKGLGPNTAPDVRKHFDELTTLELRRHGDCGMICGITVLSDIDVHQYELRNFGLSRADANSIYITQVVADEFKKRARIASTVYRLR